jgi:hypothetical protein
MSHDDVAGRHGPREVHDIRQLRMKQPGIQRQPQRRHLRQPTAEIWTHIQAKPGHVPAVADHRVRIPPRGMAHAAEPSAAGTDMRLQHLLRPLMRQVRRPDDAGGNPRRAIQTALAHRRDAGDEFRFTNGFHLLRPIRAIHRVAFQEHGRHRVMAGADVLQKLVQQITLIAAVPQMMVGVHDRQIRLQNRLRLSLRQPGRIGRIDMAIVGRFTGLGHACFPLLIGRITA